MLAKEAMKDAGAGLGIMHPKLCFEPRGTGLSML